MFPALYVPICVYGITPSTEEAISNVYLILIVRMPLDTLVLLKC